MRDFDIGGGVVATTGTSPVLESSDGAGSAAHVGVDDKVAGSRHGKDEPFDEFNGKLAGMLRLLDMVGFDVGNNPDVPWILAERVAGELPDFFAFEVAFPRVFLRYAHGVEIEIGFALGEPEDGFVPPRKPLGAMQSVFVMPDDPVVATQSELLEYGIEQGVEREHFAVVDMISDLPAYAAARFQCTNAFRDEPLLSGKPFVEADFLLVFLSDVVWRGRNEKRDFLVA